MSNLDKICAGNPGPFRVGDLVQGIEYHGKRLIKSRITRITTFPDPLQTYEIGVGRWISHESTHPVSDDNTSANRTWREMDDIRAIIRAIPLMGLRYKDAVRAIERVFRIRGLR